MADKETTVPEEETKAENTETVDMTRGELIPPEGDEKVGISVYKVLAEILKFKASLKLHERWKRSYEMRKGKHWRNAQKGIPFIAVNLTYTHLQKNVNMLTDNNPTFNIARMADVKPEEEEAFELMQHGAEHWWIDQEQQDVFDTSVNKGEDYGVCIEKVIFNRELEFGIGEVETLNVDPYHFGVYPPKRIKQARHLQKSEAVLHFYPISLREARNRWPKMADKIKPDREYLEMLGDERLEVAEGSGQGENRMFGKLISIMSTVKELLNFGSEGGTEEAEDELLIVEVWVRDRSRITEGEKSRPKYTGEIRYITCCNGGNVVMEDRDNPSINPELDTEQAMLTYLFDKYPFIVTNSVKDDVHMWGMCYDDETEILTKRGFLRFVDLSREDEVATRNKGGEFEWQRPVHYTNDPYDGDMYHFHSSSMDICVTPNHRMLVGLLNGSKKTRAERVMLASELADNINHERKIPVTSIWSDPLPELGDQIFPQTTKRSRELIISGDDYCALMGAYLAEGNTKRGTVEVAQKESSKGFVSYKALFNKLGGTYNGKAFRIYSKTLADHFKILGKADQKYIPTEIKDLPKRQLKILWDHYILGDGGYRNRKATTERGNHPRSKAHATTISKKLADDIVEVGQKLGWSVSATKKERGKRFVIDRFCNCKESYALNCRYSKYMSVKARKVRYSGRVYCVTVPNGIIYVRRNGKPAWSGNSETEQLEYLNMQFNKSISQLVAAKDKASKLILFNPRTSGVKNEDLNRYSATVQPSSAMESQGIKYLEPPRLPPEIQGSIELFQNLFFLVSQSFDLDRGSQPGKNVIAYKAIAALLEQATTMMKGKIRNYSRLVRERGRMYLSHAQNWYTEDRWITYTDENGEQVSKAIKNTNLLFPAKLTVVTGSTMPVSKVQRREEAISLFQAQGCDLEYVHEALETPHRTELIKRMRLGTVGVVFDKLRQLGAPEPVIDYLTKVTEAKDDKELKRMLERGEIPPFMQFAQMLMQAMGGQGQEQPQGPTPEEQANLAIAQAKLLEAEAKVEKEKADTALIAEKIVTERVEQRVKLKGIEFDEKKMEMDRMKILGDLGIKMESNPSKNKPGYNEKGMQSNNVE